MKAVILAAGEGRRLKPLTNLRPKPMIPIANRPLLEHVVTAVAEVDIDDIVLVVGYKRERIQTHFGDGDDWDVSIEYAVQEKQLGTGHAILQAEPFVEEEFLVLNGDCIIDSRLVERLIEGYGRTEGIAIAVTRSDVPTEYGVVELDGERVAGITEKPPWYDAKSEFINAGVYGFDERIFDKIRETESTTEGENRITEAIGRLVESETVHAVPSDGMWIDVSNLWDVLSVNSIVLDRTETSTESPYGADDAHIGSAVVFDTDCRIGPNATLLHGVSIGDNVSIGANATVSNSVILSDSTIGEGAVIKDCVVASNVDVGPNATVGGGDADVVVEENYYRDVTLGGVIGDNATVGGATLLRGGSIVGNGSTVADGVVIDETVPPHSEVRRG